MPDAIPTPLLAALLAQYPIALWVYVDARRRNLRHPEVYWLGILVPTVGFVVILYYVSERDSLPTQEAGQ